MKSFNFQTLEECKRGKKKGKEKGHRGAKKVEVNCLRQKKYRGEREGKKE